MLNGDVTLVVARATLFDPSLQTTSIVSTSGRPSSDVSARSETVSGR